MLCLTLASVFCERVCYVGVLVILTFGTEVYTVVEQTT